MAKEFKIGDRVRTLQSLSYLPANITGVIVKIEPDGVIKRNGPYGVKIDEEEDLIAFYPPEHLELIGSSDRRTKFLLRLQELLSEFDARIYDEDRYQVNIDLGIHGGNYEHLEFKYDDITADNIMDFDKE